MFQTVSPVEGSHAHMIQGAPWTTGPLVIGIWTLTASSVVAMIGKTASDESPSPLLQSPAGAPFVCTRWSLTQTLPLPISLLRFKPLALSPVVSLHLPRRSPPSRRQEWTPSGQSPVPWVGVLLFSLFSRGFRGARRGWQRLTFYESHCFSCLVSDIDLLCCSDSCGVAAVGV